MILGNSTGGVSGVDHDLLRPALDGYPSSDIAAKKVLGTQLQPHPSGVGVDDVELFSGRNAALQASKLGSRETSG